MVAPKPRVSCLMVTRDRVDLARRAIASFAGQTWRRRELVIVIDGPPEPQQALEAHVAEAGIEEVRFVRPERDDLPLGALRNLSLDAAHGDVVCQWDDDDESHPERLAIQLEHMMKKDAAASFLTDHLQLLEDTAQVSWIDWTSRGRLTGRNQLAPGTLMMRRNVGVRYPEDGPHARRGEDSELLWALYSSARVAHLQGQGHLYLYRFHGRNTFPREHHHRMARFGMPRQFLLERERQVREALAHYTVPLPAAVVGPDGPAFTVT